MRYFTNAWVLIRMLRDRGCQLPIQLWHLGEKELDVRMADLVAPFGVECVDAEERLRPLSGPNLGWALKAAAIAHSPFEEVLALDADNIPVRNPENLFDEPEYKLTGAIFWPDAWQTHPTYPIHDVMGVHYRPEWGFESGQIVINKRACWKPLRLAEWMNRNAAFFCHMLCGDKDTFRFAWHKLNQPFAMPSYPVTLLSIGARSAGLPCGVTLQYDFDGLRLFQHRNFHQWKLRGFNPVVPGTWFDPECRQFLTELQRVLSLSRGSLKLIQ